jgi:hypothetical protein
LGNNGDEEDKEKVENHFAVLFIGNNCCAHATITSSGENSMGFKNLLISDGNHRKKDAKYRLVNSDKKSNNLA